MPMGCREGSRVGPRSQELTEETATAFGPRRKLPRGGFPTGPSKCRFRSTSCTSAPLSRCCRTRTACSRTVARCRSARLVGRRGSQRGGAVGTLRRTGRESSTTGRASPLRLVGQPPDLRLFPRNSPATCRSRYVMSRVTAVSLPQRSLRPPSAENPSRSSSRQLEYSCCHNGADDRACDDLGVSMVAQFGSGPSDDDDQEESEGHPSPVGLDQHGAGSG